MFVCDNTSEEDDQNRNMFGKISAQPHPTLCIQLLDRKKSMTKTIDCHWENRFVLQQYGAVRKFYPPFERLHRNRSYGQS